MERETGIEPATSSLGNSRSLYLFDSAMPFFGKNHHIKLAVSRRDVLTHLLT